jgi:hypothetical protein
MGKDYGACEGELMIHNGYLVHPDIWLLWFAIFGTISNTFWICVLFFMRGSESPILKGRDAEKFLDSVRWEPISEDRQRWLQKVSEQSKQAEKRELPSQHENFHGN